MSLKDEIFQQPDVIRNLLDEGWQDAWRIADDLREFELDYIFLTARGTSDNAGLYAKYLWGIKNNLPVALAGPSMFSMYDAPPDLTHALVVGISQSGQSHDILEVMETGVQKGAPTLAITNYPDSPMGKAAEYVLDIRAGEETSVAATKTYTAQLMSIAMFSAAMAGDESAYDELRLVPALMEEVLQLDSDIQHMVERFYYMEHCIVLGRGFNYATAFEWALKLKEMSYVGAEAYSSADFMHGPIAIIDRGFPILAIAPAGKVYSDLFSVIETFRKEHQPNLVVISNRDQALSMADIKIPLPERLTEWLSPLVAIIPGQLFTYHLTKAKGFDTENPRGLQKVTYTR